MWVLSLGWEDDLEKEMATYLSILAWDMPWTEESRDYSPWGPKDSDTTEHTHTHLASTIQPQTYTFT